MILFSAAGRLDVTKLTEGKSSSKEPFSRAIGSMSFFAEPRRHRLADLRRLSVSQLPPEGPLDVAQESHGRVSIAPVGQLLIRKTGRRQYKSSYGHALDHVH
jgi:hypothetical protein